MRSAARAIHAGVDRQGSGGWPRSHLRLVVVARAIGQAQGRRETGTYDREGHYRDDRDKGLSANILQFTDRSWEVSSREKVLMSLWASITRVFGRGRMTRFEEAERRTEEVTASARELNRRLEPYTQAEDPFQALMVDLYNRRDEIVHPNGMRR